MITVTITNEAMNDQTQHGYCAGDIVKCKEAKLKPGVKMLLTRGTGLLLTEVVAVDDRAIKCKKWNPISEFTLPRKDITSVYAITQITRFIN